MLHSWNITGRSGWNLWENLVWRLYLQLFVPNPLPCTHFCENWWQTPEPQLNCRLVRKGKLLLKCHNSSFISKNTQKKGNCWTPFCFEILFCPFLSSHNKCRKSSNCCPDTLQYYEPIKIACTSDLKARRKISRIKSGLNEHPSCSPHRCIKRLHRSVSESGPRWPPLTAVML